MNNLLTLHITSWNTIYYGIVYSISGVSTKTKMRKAYMFTFTRTRPLSPPLRETNNFKRPGLLIHQSYVFISFRLFSFILFDICILHDDLHSRSFVQYINTGQQIRPAYISALSLCRTTARKFPFYDLALFWISASRESLLYLYIFFGMMRYLINMLWPVDTHTRAHSFY